MEYHLFYLAVVYLLTLVLLNCIPHVSVKYIGWFGLCGVRIHHRETTIHIRGISLRPNLCWRSPLSFGAVRLYIGGVRVVLNGPSGSTRKQPKPKSCDGTPQLNFTFPSWVYTYIIRNPFLKESAVFANNILIDHYALKPYRFRVGTVRLEGLKNLVSGTQGVDLTVLDGYLLEGPSESQAGTRVFHSLDLELLCEAVFTCVLPKSDQKMNATLTNFGLKFAVSDIFIPDISKLKLAEQTEKHKSNRLPVEHTEPNASKFLRAFNLISFVRLKVEDSVINYRDIRVETSSYAASYSKDISFKQLAMGKFSFYVTAGKLFHLELKCLELPSLTYLFEADISDYQRAVADGNSTVNTVDISSSLSLTHPTFTIFFDQLSSVLNHENKMKEPKLKPAVDFTVILRILKNVRKALIKLLILDTKVILHTPERDLKIFRRDSYKNVICNGEFLFLAFKTSSKNLGRIIERKCMGKSNLVTMKGYLRMKNLRLEVENNELLISGLNTLIGYCLNYQSISLKVISKQIYLNSVNSMIFHVIKLIRETKRTQMNLACAQDAENMRSESELDSSRSQDILNVDLFELLPSMVRSVRFDSDRVVATIMCNDWLPDQMITTEDGEEINLGSFKRGVSFTVKDFSLTYKRKEEIFKTTIQQIQADTLSDLSREYTDDLDHITKYENEEIDFEDLSSLNSSLSNIPIDDIDGNIKSIKRVLFINNIVVENPKNVRDKLDISIPEVDGRIDIFFVWCWMYARTMVHIIAPEVEKTYSKEQEKRLNRNKKSLNVSVNVHSLAMMMKIPNNVDIMYEVDQLQFRLIDAKPKCVINYLRLYLVHPATNLWCRLVSITDLHVNLSNISKTNINLSSKAVRFNIPFQFLVYTVIDNLITFFKSVRQVKHNFLNLSLKLTDFSRLMPEARPAVKVPRINWTSSIVGITLENDAFESELALIYELGGYEQVDRLRKAALFDEKVKEVRSRIGESLTKEPVSPRRFLSKSTLMTNSESKGPFAALGLLKKEFSKTSHSTSLFKHHNESQLSSSGRKTIDAKCFLKGSKKKGTPSSGKSSPSNRLSNSDTLPNDGTELLTEASANRIISAAKIALEKDLATSWIRKFKKFRDARRTNIRNYSRNIWDDEEVNLVIKSKFQIQDYSPGMPQFTGVFRNFDLLVDQAQIDNIDDFLRLHGKGQPKLLYSILIPFFFRLKSTSVHFQAKDYTIPILSFPAKSHGDSPVMDFLGNLVINEMLVSRKEEMRHIFVPFSPAVTSSELIDNFYSVHIPRTLTPVKFMFDLYCGIKTDRACVLSWSKSYQPALLGIMQSFDNFTKPPIDDSPLGWWDKIALLAHGKLRFDIENELCLHIKSSMSPYQLVGENSGFVFCWKNDVLLKINHTPDISELVTLESHDFILGVPNYSTAETRSWSLFYKDKVDFVHESEDESKKFQKRVLKFSSDEKVLWKLGFAFERNVDNNSTELGSDQERTSVFKPHYDVVVTNPLFDWHPDSYENYRSDYLHMAISVCSKSSKKNCFNSAYLTPVTIKYFMRWWNTLTDSISLPVREGKLFSLHKIEKTLVKMGAHLFTFKYQLEIEPLTVSNLHLTYEPKSKEHNIIFTGLKSKLSRCVIDLHQRKEVVRYVNEKLGINKKIRKLKLYLGEIDLTDADIRLFYAKFREPSLKGQLMSYYVGDSHHSPQNLGSTQTDRKQMHPGMSDWKGNLGADDETFSWLDVDDFIELEEKEILSADPVLSVQPFCFTPRFTYFREFTLESYDSKFPFGEENSHHCLIGKQSPDQVQAMILKKRVDQIRQDLSDKNETLQTLERSTDAETQRDCASIRKQIMKGNKTMNHVVSIYEDVATSADISERNSLTSKLTSHTNASKNTEGSDYEIKKFDSNYQASNLMKINSTAHSVYSTYKSIEQAREVVSSHASASSYHNRFLIHNLQLIWNNKVRDLFKDYLLLVSDRRTQTFSLTKRATDLVESILKKTDSESVSKVSSLSPESIQNFNTNEDILEGFEEYLLNNDNPEHEIENKYLIKFIRPQVQLISELDTNACVLQTSQDVELRIIDVNIEGTNDVINEDKEQISTIATRFGLYLKDSFAFAFDKSKFSVRDNDPYGNHLNRQSWPPWVNCEECDEVFTFEEDLVLERTTMAYTFEKPNLLCIGSAALSQVNEIKVHLAKVVVNATSAQYSAIYFVITDLLLHGDSARDRLHRRLKQIATVSDVSDLEGYSEKVFKLQTNIRICRYILLKMDERTVILSKRELQERALVELEIERMRLELEVIIQMTRLAGDRNSMRKELARNWTVNADQIIWHILDDDREPLVDFALASSKFCRTDKFDGSNTNILEVSMLQGFNLRPSAVYPELLRPYLEIAETKFAEMCNKAEPIIKMKWEMLNPVGGIKVMKNADLKIQPMHIQLDYETGNKLFNYMFPKEDELSKESSLLTDDEDSASIMSASSPDSSNPFRKMMAKRRSSSIHSRGSRSGQSSKVETSDESSYESLSNISTRNVRSHDTSLSILKKKKHEIIPAVDELNLIMNRSSKYIAIEELYVHKVRLCISFKAPKHLNIIDVHNLQLAVPTIFYENKTWSGHDLAMHLKKDVIRVVLNHSGKIIGNKFKQRKRKESDGPLKQISDYSLYMTLDELQKEGRPRGEIYGRYGKLRMNRDKPEIRVDTNPINDNKGAPARVSSPLAGSFTTQNEFDGLHDVSEEESDVNGS